MRALKTCLVILSLLSVVVEVCCGGDLNLQLMATMTGENEGDALGGRVKGLGDINGDGCDDVTVSVEGYNDRSGRVNVCFGSSEFDNIPDMTLNGHEPREYFGFCIGAGDVNGDQQNEVIIGAPGSKKAYLYFGGALLDTLPDLIFEEPTGPLGGFPGDVASAGDVNGDGFDDVMASSVNEGKVYLYLGGENMDTVADAVFYEGGDLLGSSISSAGDVNGDGYDDMIMGQHNYPLFSAYLYLGGSPLDTIADYVFYHPQVTSGDVNDDGYSDVITSGGGETCIFFGGVTMDTIPDIVITEFSGRAFTGYFNKGNYADIIIGDGQSYGGLGSAWVFLGGNPMDSISDWGIVGEYGGELGASVASAGDVNGDSVEDVIIGEPGYSFGSGIGRAYVYAGASGVEDWDQQYRLPREFELEQNYPNPFNATTLIPYTLSAVRGRPSAVTLKIYNLLGEEVRTLVDRRQRAGYYEVTWDGKDSSGRQVGSGIYFYQLRVQNQKGGVAQKTRKMLLIR